MNTEAKLLLLSYAFETLGLQKIVLKTELRNQQSQRAIERLGANREGIFLKHLIADNGRVRDMVYYAIFASDWPTARDGLLRACGMSLRPAREQRYPKKPRILSKARADLKPTSHTVLVAEMR